MSSITAEFEFEIGDLVFTRDAEHSNDARPKTFCIYERLAQECHGGIQRLYKVVGFKEAVPEVLLTKEEPPFCPVSNAWLKDRVRVMVAERAAPYPKDRWSSVARAAKKLDPKEDPPA